MQLDEHVHPGALTEAGKTICHDLAPIYLDVNTDVVWRPFVESVELNRQAATGAFLGDGT